MTSLRPLLIASAFALTAVSAAHAADATAGTYKLAFGASTTCPVTLAADGTATFAADCTQGAHVAKWQAKFHAVELQTASGETVALLHGKDGSYSGTRYADGRALTLVSDSAVASTH
ncbi:MAG TPA: AprI/Inh family metalloprotease inhibitor [Rhizomicrobium sp.]|nr:AprI/Inh family metalloprotease inhibitor [Rhizomicrobium sp.]